MINQNFRPAGAYCPSSVACCRHCRRGDRLNPFNDVARGIDLGHQKEGSLSGTSFPGPARERGDPCSDEACPAFPSLLLISFRLSFRSILFYFSKERSMAVAHSENLSLNGVMGTMCRGAIDDVCRLTIQTWESYTIRFTKK